MTAGKRDFRHFGKARHPARRLLRRALILLAAFFLIYTFLTTTLISSVMVGSVSMEPTLSTSDRVMVSPLVYGARIPFTSHRFKGTNEPKRGDLVFLMPPFAKDNPLQRLADPFVSFFTFQNVRIMDGTQSDWEASRLIKRIIAVPGDTVMMEDYVAFVKPADASGFLNERQVSEKEYSITLTPLPEGWSSQLPLSGNVTEVVLQDGEYFVLGDNRTQSHDSRQFGVITGEHLIARVVFRYWPLRRAGIL